MKHHLQTTRLTALLALVLAVGCQPDLGPQEEERLRSMAAGSDLAPPPSPTNAYADDPAAAELGRRLFFDEDMSRDGEVSCATCHDPDDGWSDPNALSEGVEGLLGDRHSMPIPMASFQTFVLWDGRADSLWSQPLMALENEVEMDFTRTEVAHHVARRYAVEYEAVFGALPDLADIPERAKPGTSAWTALSHERRDAVQRVFANVGKAIEAYERRIDCIDTRFDRWARGEITLSAAERAGAAAFVREDCIECHSDVAFTDFEFHNIGIGSGVAEPDDGRASGPADIRENPFNAAGVYSDDAAYGRAVHEAMVHEDHTLGAFRTPTLRGVGQRRFFGHRGHHEALESFLDAVYDGPELEDTAVGRLDPEVEDVDVGNTGDMAAFLHTLDCPSLPAALLEPGRPSAH